MPFFIACGRKILPALCLLLTASVATGAATPVNALVVSSAEDHALTQLVDLLQQTTTLQADVEQLLMDQEGRELQQTTAKLLMQKPENFRWEIVKPYDELMVTDGKSIWRYEPDLDQVTIATFNRKLDHTPVMLLNGSVQTIGDNYEVTAAMTDAVHQRFILLPKRSDSLFERLSLTFNGATLEEMQFEDSLGQQTSLTFKSVQRNLPVDAGKFQFTPPRGVEVIDNTAN